LLPDPGHALLPILRNALVGITGYWYASAVAMDDWVLAPGVGL